MAKMGCSWVATYRSPLRRRHRCTPGPLRRAPDEESAVQEVAGWGDDANAVAMTLAAVGGGQSAVAVAKAMGVAVRARGARCAVAVAVRGGGPW